MEGPGFSAMNRISRYMMRQLVAGVIFASLGLSGIIWLTQSLRFVEAIVNRGLSAEDFFYLTILLLPNFLTIVLPISLFIVVIFVYSKMNGDRELVILRAAGVSPLAIARPAIYLGLAVTVIGYSLSLYFTPLSYRGFRIMQWEIRHSLAHMVMREGAFNLFSDDITVYIRERTGKNELLDILVHDGRDKKKPITYLAKRGLLMETPTGARVVMFHGNRQEIDRKAPKKSSTLYFDQYNLDLSAINRNIGERFREARERAIGELLTLNPKDVGNPKDYQKFVVEGHQRITSPLNSLGFLLVGLVCLFSGDFSRRGQSVRIVVATSIVVSIQASSLGLGNLAAKNLDLIPLLYVNAILPILFGFVLLLVPWRWRNPFAKSPAPEYAQ